MNWWILLTQPVRLARSLALDKAGSSIAARIAIMAMTTSSSMRVKAYFERGVKRTRLAIDFIVGSGCFDCDVISAGLAGHRIGHFDRAVGGEHEAIGEGGPGGERGAKLIGRAHANPGEPI